MCTQAGRCTGAALKLTSGQRLDGDGFVDSAELVDLLALMGKPTSEGNVRALVDRIDSSGTQCTLRWNSEHN